EDEERLLLARDHLGVKPLYYLDSGTRMLFGSEMRAILSNPEVRTELDPDGLRLFLHFGYVPAPHTLVEGLKKLPPGHALVSDRSGSRLRRYWVPTTEIDTSITIDEAVEVCHELTTAAVERQMVSDVPVGILLSGGVDSAMILAAASDRTNQQLSTFTVGFGDDFAMDEARQAAGTAAMFNTDHHEIRIKPRSFPEVFEQSLWHMEEPVLSQSTFAFQMLTAEVSKHVKVVLTGQGADEPWAGYHRYIGERYGAKARWLFGSTAASVGANHVPGGARLRRATASLGEPDPVERFAAIHQVFSPEQINANAHGALTRARVTPQDAIRYWQEPVAHLDHFSQLLHVDSRMSLADDLLFYGDKLSMSNGVEARVPFLDRELFDFVESLPPSFKLRMGKGKYVHKLVAEKMLPKELVYRTKRGFDTPVDEWFAADFAPLLHENVLDPESLCSSILDRGLLRSLIEEHVSGRRNHRRQLTALLSLELSARQILTRPTTPHFSSANQEITEVAV
ncbi:MAG: asparagine synthase (glutamine-hydrolyzing), partial [Acidimicrobiales bacterium]